MPSVAVAIPRQALMKTPTLSSVLRASALLAAVLAIPQAYAVEVYLDFSGAEPLLHGSWVDGGYGDGGPFSWTASDFLTTQHAVKAKMEAIFAPFTSVSFHNFADVPGVPHPTLSFGATGGAAGLLGLSSTLDWRNSAITDGAVIYSGKFGSTFTAGTTVPEKVANLDRLANALSNIAAHELGHTFGLQHYDAYGLPEIKAPGYAGITGQQNGKIMSSGPSGATIFGLGDGLKTFSELSINKLEYAAGVVPTVGKTVSEVAGSKDTLATAQEVTSANLFLSGKPAVNITGRTSSVGQLDLYKFEAQMGNLLTLNTFSDLIIPDRTNTSLGLYNSAGTLIASSTDISYAGDSFMTGAGFYSTDSLILNFEATYTGTYYAGVLGLETTGDYNLLITGAVPEPSVMILGGIAAVALLRKRKVIKT
ncbi:MAG: hypothetical protein KF824_01935 [Fimbriimonadaceae bacterium]|nr:MAG: hypothetical protein KF824_01935 [Fimbriimonadaceae bacterium]